jgi:CRISPR-associated protein (Cas_Csd1)
MRPFYEFGIKPPEGVIFPPLNYREANVDYCVTIDLDGELIRVAKEERKIITPDRTRSGKKPPPILCFDKFNYLVKTSSEHVDRVQSSILLYRQAIEISQDSHLKAILAFIDRGYLISELQSLKDEAGIIKDENNCVFRIKGEEKYIHDAPTIIQCWQQLRKEELDLQAGECAISHQHTQILGKEFRTVNGIPDAKGKPGLGKFFTNNKKSVQNWNSDSSMFQHRVGLDTYIAIYNGLSYLLDKKEHHIRLGDAKYVFWAAGETESKAIPVNIILNPEQEIKEIVPSALNVMMTLTSIFKHSAAIAQGNPDTFYIASFRRSQNRAWIDTIQQGKVSEIYHNIEKWIKIQSIFTDRVLGVLSLARSLMSQSTRKDRDKHPARSDLDAIVQNCLFAAPLPQHFIGTLINHIAAARKATQSQINLLTLALDLNHMDTNMKPNIDLSKLSDSEKDAYIFGQITSFIRYLSHRVSHNDRTLADSLEQHFLQSPTAGATQMMKLFTMYVKSAKSEVYWRDRFNQEFPIVPVASHRFTIREQAIYLIGANWYQALPKQDKPDNKKTDTK